MIPAAETAPAGGSCDHRGGLKTHWPLLVLIAVYLAVRSCFWNFQPLWDGADFESALLKANQLPFDLLNYSLDAHVCQGFFLVLSLPYKWFKHDYYRFNVWLSLFCVLGIVAFYRLLWLLTNRRAGGLELALGAAMFAFHPTVLASMIHFTLDIGLVIFLLCYWMLLLENRRWLAMVAGLLLMLTKELALVLLPLAALFCMLREPTANHRAWLRRNWFAVAVPYGGFAFILADKFFRHEPLLWKMFGFQPNILLSNFAALVFVLNFGWLIFAAWLGLFAWAAARGRLTGEALANAWLIGLIFVCACGVLFYARPFSNPRYLMAPVAFMLLGLACLLLSAGLPRAARLGILLPLLALLGVSDLRTVDPLSKAFFGKFNFGRHEMLSICRRTGECGGVSRDQLVYNLEYLNLSQLTRRMIKDVRPTGDTFILCDPRANWFLLPALDAQTGKPTMDIGHSFLPHYPDMLVVRSDAKYQISGAAYSLNELPADLYYVEYPNVDNQNQIERLSSRFAHKTEKVYDLNGYQIAVIHFTE